MKKLFCLRGLGFGIENGRKFMEWQCSFFSSLCGHRMWTEELAPEDHAEDAFRDGYIWICSDLKEPLPPLTKEQEEWFRKAIANPLPECDKADLLRRFLKLADKQVAKPTATA